VPPCFGKEFRDGNKNHNARHKGQHIVHVKYLVQQKLHETPQIGRYNVRLGLTGITATVKDRQSHQRTERLGQTRKRCETKSEPGGVGTRRQTGNRNGNALCCRRRQGKGMNENIKAYTILLDLRATVKIVQMY